MIRRREFLLTGLAASARAQGGRKIRQVDIIHHTHTDVGYTALPSVIRDLQVRYLEIAVDACAADPAFRWTVEALLGLDDWWRNVTPARRAQLAGLVKAGRMDVMAMPFNQTAFLDAAQWRQMLEWIPRDRWRELNIRVAMQNDVNGIPRAGAVALLDRGIRHLMMGINADSGGPPFRRPDAFWWKMPDGRRMFVWLGEHYGYAMPSLLVPHNDLPMATDEAAVRRAAAEFTKRLAAMEAAGYAYERLILTFTNPLNYDNGGPFPSLSPFVAAWKRLGLEPKLRLTTATEAVMALEKEAGPVAPVLEGEWTDWWANGDASGPREVAASRVAKRNVAAAHSPVFGPMPERGTAETSRILRDLCLFDEHTWGAANSISAPYSHNALAQYVEKSDLAYRPMGMSDYLLKRRVRTKVDALDAGIYAINPCAEEVSGWVQVPSGEAGPEMKSVVDVETGRRWLLAHGGGQARFWVERLPGHSLRRYRAEAAAVVDTGGPGPDVKLDGAGWPVSARWSESAAPGMRLPLFDGALGEFVCVGVVPPADRRTITSLHAKWDREKWQAAFRQSRAEFGPAKVLETAHSIVYTQPFTHPRIAKGRRVVELWRREARARVSVRFDRLTSEAPEVLFLEFALPHEVELPVFTAGGMKFTPYRDQLKGTCRDYFAIDGRAEFAGPDGRRVWVTRDAPLVTVGGPHVVERHQQEPKDHHRILAMVFDNCWHTNFVADSHGPIEFEFDLGWQRGAGELIAIVRGGAIEEDVVRKWIYRP